MCLWSAVGLVGSFVLLGGQVVMDYFHWMTLAGMTQLSSMRSHTLDSFTWLPDRVLSKRMEECQASGSLGSELSHCHFSWPKEFTKSVRIPEEKKQTSFIDGRSCKVTLRMVWS